MICSRNYDEPKIKGNSDAFRIKKICLVIRHIQNHAPNIRTYSNDHLLAVLPRLAKNLRNAS